MWVTQGNSTAFFSPYVQAQELFLNSDGKEATSSSQAICDRRLLIYLFLVSRE